MRSLTSLDAFFLAAEDGRSTANVSSLSILSATGPDGTRLTRTDIQDLIAERLHLLPPLRWRLAEVPFGLGHPYWVDGDVDLDFHVRELAVVAPGDQAALESQVARLSAHPMDRSRPLWEIHLIHGLVGDKVALLIKLHHAAVDGMSAAEIMTVLFDDTAAGRAIAPAPRPRAERAPGQLELLARGIAATPQRQLNAIGAAGRTLTNLDHVATLRSIPGIRPIGSMLRNVSLLGRASGTTAPAPSITAPRLHINGRITPHRNVALTSLPLDEITQIRRDLDYTVNDVVMALCAGAIRRWLDGRGELPDQPLVAAVPVSVRTAKESGRYGNKVGTMIAELPTDEASTLLRLKRCRQGMQDAKQRNDTVPASLMRDANDLVPPVVFGPAMRMVTRMASSEAFAPAANVLISNVPGPRSGIYLAGHPVHEQYPVSTISDSLALNITVYSYRDRLHIGLVGDRKIVDDLPGLAVAFGEELQSMHKTKAAICTQGATR
ncbi:WS/DGAT/MGAT family O-acyltransferase [Gordonia rhizosphera]|uniref:Diacylglycerol O-acyltransferase n=1 Tax=Gordonia rhizosphera NBRC 16068 TaxID=1108045 RepID=K6WMQ1_9ACTN|nr:wax ester/triacylglycerol synthase family O-acyltransferase [Gordonia rhizosphera]GAB93407.1 putative wax ester synthase/diacylglycerol acyltransferase [Gordonia rhizosphera NBRC 16068]